jgi:hypothetical protein
MGRMKNVKREQTTERSRSQRKGVNSGSSKNQPMEEKDVERLQIHNVGKPSMNMEQIGDIPIGIAQST